MLILLFTTVLVAQAVTFALVLAMPTPMGAMTQLSAVASALRTGRSGNDQLRVDQGDMPWDNWTDPAERRTAALLAATLGVPSDRVRLISLRAFGGDRPEQPGPANPRGLMPRDLVPQSLPAIAPARDGAAPDSVILGRFEAGLKLPDGRWRRVTRTGERIAAWQWQVLLWLVGSTAVVAPFAWFFARRIAAPIAAFGAAARRLGSNPASAPIDVRGPPEIGAASAALNDMQRQVSRYVEDRTMVVAAIAHDLRTPLMRLALRLQQAPDAIRVAGEQDIQEIETMATAALSFVRDLSVREVRHRLALRALVETVTDEFRDRGEDVALAARDDATAVADGNGLKRMLTNIVGNAVIYGGCAAVRLEVHGDHAVIAVEDAGPGIPPDQLDRVFDPFYRLEQSRNKQTGGAGLGLASARAVARAHGGDIVLSNRSAGGLLATISLPL